MVSMRKPPAPPHKRSLCVLATALVGECIHGTYAHANASSPFQFQSHVQLTKLIRSRK
jgi:hypothetical protein